MIANAGGLDAAQAKWGEDASGIKRAGKWEQVRLVMKATSKASRVAGFIVMWAIAMRDEGRDSFTITEYQRYWNEAERQAYRHLSEFRELWPDYETPDALARQVLAALPERPNIATLTAGVAVVA